MLNRFCAVLTLGLVLCSFSADGAEKIKRILYINSYCISTTFAHDIMSGFQSYLARHNIQAGLDYRELDVCGTPGLQVAPYRVAAIQSILDSKYFDLIITNGNEAAKLFTGRRLKVRSKRTSLIIVNFYGSILQSQPTGLPTTGVLAIYPPYAVVKMGLALKPDTEKVVIVTGAMDDSKEYLERLKHNLAAAPRADIEIISGFDYSLRSLAEKLKTLPEKSLVAFHSWNSLEDSKNHNVGFAEDLSKHTGALILGSKDSHRHYGAAGGMLITGTDFGEKAGELAMRIFNGEAASSIPFSHIKPRSQLEFSALEKYGISRKNADRAGVNLLNAPHNIFSEHWQEILIASFGILLILQLALMQIYYYRRMINQLKGLMEKMPMQLTLTDVHGKVLFSNIPEEERDVLRPVGNLSELGDVGDLALQKLAELDNSGAERILFEHKEGGRHYHTSLCKLDNDRLFRTRAFLGVTLNITDRHHTRMKFENMAERFYQTLHSIGDAVIAADERECVTFMNPIAEALTGYTMSQAKGQPLEKIFHIVNAMTGEKVESPLSIALNEGRRVALANHTVLISADGKEYHIADSASPIKNRKGEMQGGVLVFRDVTQEYARSDRTRRMAVVLEHFRRTARFSDFVQIPGEKLDFNDLSEDIWGRENGRALPPERWIAAGDLEKFYADYKKLESGEISEFHLSFTTVPEQPRRYFEMWLVSTRDEHRERNEIHGLIQDVTAIRAGEIRYLNSMKMLNTIMENLPGVLFVKNVDDNFRYVAVNNNFIELLRCPREEAEGRTDYELFANLPEQAERFRKDDFDTVQNEFLDRIETVSYCDNMHTMRTIKTIVRQEDGPCLLIGMSIDISQRAKLEKEREEMIENLNQLIEWEQLTNYLLLGSISLQGGEFDAVVSRNLSRIGEATGTEHVYIFRYTAPERSHAVLEYGWDRATGKVERNIDDIKLDLTLLKDTRDVLAEHGECYYTVEPYPDGKWTAEQETMKSFPDLYARHFAEITVNGKPYGFFGLDYRRGNYHRERFSTLIRTLAQLYQIDCERDLKIRQLHESQKFMAQLIENIDIPLTLCDEDYNLIMINEKARKNARPEFDSEWRSRKPGELIKCYNASACGDGKGNPSDFCPVKRCLATGQSCSIPHEWQGIHMISSGQFLHDQYHDCRYILVADVDITERVNNEQRLREALEAAKAAERAKSVFLATMSHEIRTPLNAIIGFSDILNSAELPPEEQKENIQAIHFAGNALLTLINDILDLSKLEAGQMSLAIQKCDFGEVLHGIGAIFQVKIREKNLQYREIIPENLPVMALDPLRIKQILLNLIGNAVKFTAYGRITVAVDFEPKDEAAGTLKISVRDTGCGIAPEYRSSIFQPFFQQDVVRDSHAYNGTGLGLSISKRLAGRMGGELYLESSGDHGSVFVLEIPAVKYYADAVTAAEPEGSDGGDDVLSASRILIVDDVQLNLKVLGSMLRKSGMEPLEAASAAEALALLEKGVKVDLVLTDLWMPGMNGAEFAEAVHKIPSCAGLRVIALTADVEMARNFPQEHFSGRILKPVTMTKLRQVLKS